jgi:hypothetical protein
LPASYAAIKDAIKDKPLEVIKLVKEFVNKVPANSSVILEAPVVSSSFAPNRRHLPSAKYSHAVFALGVAAYSGFCLAKWIRSGTS